MQSAGTQGSATRMLGDILNDVVDIDEVEVRIVRWSMLFLTLCIIAMTIVTTVIVNLGSKELFKLSELSVQSSERASLYEACSSLVELSIMVNQHSQLNMTLEEAESIFGTVEEMQLHLKRDVARY